MFRTHGNGGGWRKLDQAAQAALDGSVRKLEALLAGPGTDPNARTCNGGTANWPLLHIAAAGHKGGAPAAVAALIRAGADLAAEVEEDGGLTAVHVAALNGNAAVIAVLAQVSGIRAPCPRRRAPATPLSPSLSPCPSPPKAPG